MTIFNFDVLNQEEEGSPLKGQDPYNIGNNQTVIDADTIHEGNTGQNIRIADVDARETTKVIDGQFIKGQHGGDEATALTAHLVKEGGFNIPIYSGEVDATGNRQVGDYRNAQGELLSSKLLESNLADLTNFSSDGQISAALQGRLDRVHRKNEGIQNEWDIANEIYTDTVSQEELRAKPIALTEAHYAAAPDFYSGANTQIRRGDRTLDNVAKSSVSTAWALGTSGIVEGYYGALDMFSDLFGFENVGQQDVERLQREIADLPELANISAFDEEGNWTIDGAGQFLDYVLTNATISAPYMVQSIVAAALAAPTFGGSLAFPALTYAGQTYNGQEKKNAAVAITSGVVQGALDYFGIRGAGKVLGTKLSKEATKDIVNEIAKKKFNGNVKAAEAAFANYTMRQMAQVSNAAKSILAKQIKPKYLAQTAGGTILKGGASESVTETLQELTATLGENYDDLSRIDEKELKNRLLNAAVAGGVLGGGFSTIGAANNAFQQYDAVQSHSAADLQRASEDFKFQEDLKAEGVSVNLDDHLQQADDVSQGIIGNLDEQRAGESKRRLDQDIFGAARDIIRQGPGFLWRGIGSHLHNLHGRKNRNIAVVTSILGGHKGFAGESVEDYQRLSEANLQGFVGTEDQALVTHKRRNLRQVSEIYADKNVNDYLDTLTTIFEQSKTFRDFKEAASARGLNLEGKFAQDQDAVLDFGYRLYLRDKKKEDYTGKKTPVGESRKEKILNKEIVRARRAEFIRKLTAATGYSEKEITEMVNDYLDISNTTKLDDVFDDLLRTEPLKPKDFDFESINNDPEFNDFFNHNLFYNLAADNSKTAARAANEKYLGTNGNKVAFFLEKARQEGVDDATIGFLAEEISDFMKIRAGEYNRIESDLWRNLQSKFMTLTVFNSLPLATVSSLVELAIVSKSLNKQQIFGIISKAAKESAYEAAHLFGGVAKVGTGGQISPFTKNTELREKANQLGLISGSGQAEAHRQDVAQSRERDQRWINMFFRFTGLQSLTNFNRTIRLAGAFDAIKGWAESIAAEGSTPSRESLEAREALINLGVDIDLVVKAWNGPLQPKQQEAFDRNMNRAMFNFVNDAVANPTKANRPKMYQNPKTAIFFQFQGFIATFTANILPKLYKGVVSGTPGSKVNAIATIGMLLFMGFLASHLRDLIKYGKPTPYLDGYGQFQRALGASGLLGVGERVVNAIHPLYDKKHDNWVEQSLDFIQGEAPTLGYAGKIGDFGVSIFAEDDPGKIAKKGVKAAPIVGPFNELANAVEDLF